VIQLYVETFLVYARIAKHTILLFYVQVITNEEAERRGKNYDANGMTYLFDLDYQDPDCPYTVDAGIYGNVSHFVNHSVGLLNN
jgi:histone-lysine N-methyltransferase SUV39H